MQLHGSQRSVPNPSTRPVIGDLDAAASINYV
jgi:hypothetical protein